MRGSPGGGVASAALIILGLSPLIVSPSLGPVVTIAGLVLLIAFLLVVLRGAWHGDKQRAGGPSPLRREQRDKRVAKRK